MEVEKSGMENIEMVSIVEYSRGGSIAEECQESIVEGGRDVLVRKINQAAPTASSAALWGFLSSFTCQPR